jgi:hypothetical protein
MKTIIIAILLAVVSSSGYAKTWRVNNNSIYTTGCKNCFSSLQDANNSTSVSPGDTIHLEASGTDYTETLISKRLVIIGTGYFLDENGSLQQNLVSATVLGIELNAGSAGTTLIGVNIANAYAADIDIRVGDIKILKCYIEDGIYFYNSSPSTLNNIIINQCYIGRAIDDPYDPGAINNLNISNSYIDGYIEISVKNNNYSGVFAHNAVKGTITGSSGIKYYNNIFKNDFTAAKNSTTNVYNNIFTKAVPSWLSSSSNISVAEATVFLSSGSSDGKLKVNPSNICPDCYTGYPGGTAEIGMFGGNTPYVLSGISTIPTIYDLKGGATSFKGDTIKIQIGTRSND